MAKFIKIEGSFANKLDKVLRSPKASASNNSTIKAPSAKDKHQLWIHHTDIKLNVVTPKKPSIFHPFIATGTRHIDTFVIKNGVHIDTLKGPTKGNDTIKHVSGYLNSNGEVK